MSRLRSFDAKFKLEVIKKAEETSKEAAAREFSVSPKSVRDWTKRKANLEIQAQTGDGAKRKRLDGGGAKVTSDEMESRVFNWIMAQRSKCLRVSRRIIQEEAKRIFPTVDDKRHTSFVASVGWLSKFINRHQLSVRKRTTISQKDPADIDDRVLKFLKFVDQEKKLHSFEASDIINMDETASWFDMLGNNTVNPKGAKTISIQGTGHEKTHCTVCLSAKADGTKLKPMIVFKGAIREVKSLQNIPGVVVVSSRNGWMDDPLTKVWLDKVYGQIAFKQRMLVWDSYRAHISAFTKSHFVKFKSSMMVIPGVCTKYLQPADISWNKPFKQSLEDSYSDWMSNEENKTFTKGGNMRAPARCLLVLWVKKSWDSLSPDLIKKSFRFCGLSVNTDGSEDEEISIFKREQFSNVFNRFQAYRSETGPDLVNMEDEEDEEELYNNEVVISDDDEDDDNDA